MLLRVIARIDTLSNRITELRDIYNSSMSRKLQSTVENSNSSFRNICSFNFYCWNLWDEFSVYARATTSSVPHCFLIRFHNCNWHAHIL